MLAMEAYVPKIDPRTPRSRMATSLTTMNHHDRDSLNFPTLITSGGLSFQKVRMLRKGGKMKARAQLATAPISVMSPLRSGMAMARPAAVRGGREGRGKEEREGWTGSEGTHTEYLLPVTETRSVRKAV